MYGDHKITNDVYEINFPHELMGEAVGDVDLQMLGSDSLRLVEYFSKHNELSDIQYEVLQECCEDLPVVIAAVAEEYKEYFRRLHIAVCEVIELLENQS